MKLNDELVSDPRMHSDLKGVIVGRNLVVFKFYFSISLLEAQVFLSRTAQNVHRIFRSSTFCVEPQYRTLYKHVGAFIIGPKCTLAASHAATW